ncbi:hypothetical protein JCM14469_06310 [Desulfatiferula olefinivorans]
MQRRFRRNHDLGGVTLVSVLPTRNHTIRRFLLMTLGSLVLVFILTLLGGCSGGGESPGTLVPSSTPTPGGNAPTPPDDDDGFSGAARVSGTIKLSYLSSSDSNLIASSDDPAAGRVPGLRARTSKAVDPQTEAVRLYVVGDNGELTDTGISCGLTDGENGDRVYECDGVRDGVNYIVRYVKLNADTGKALELKSTAYIPEGDTTPDGDVLVTPQSSVVVKALVDAILSATAGTNIDTQVVNTIINRVKAAIETLVSSGAVQIPSMVVDVDEGTGLDDLVGTDPENENLDNTAGIILADDTVGGELDYIAANTQAALFNLAEVDTEQEKTDLILRVFREMMSDKDGGSEDMPRFFYDFFIWHYVTGRSVTVGNLLQTLIDSMTYEDSVPQTVRAQVTVPNVLDRFNTFIARIHSLIARITELEAKAALTPDQATELTAKKAELARTPSVIRGLFPAAFLPATEGKNLVTPQGIALVIFFEDVFMTETVNPDTIGLTGTAGEGGQIIYNDDLFEWDDEDLFTLLGISTYIAAYPDRFQGIDIFGLDLHPGTVWIEGTADTPDEEREALMLNTDFMNLAGFIDDDQAMELDGSSGATVSLTYPKASGGTGTVPLLYVTHDDGYGSWGINPWQEAHEGMDPQSTDPVVIDPTRVISDFTSGDYTVTVNYNGTTTTKTFQKTVITGMTDTYAKMVTPAGMPIWPGDNPTDAEMTAYNEAWTAFERNGGRTNFTANVKDDGTAPAVGETATKAKITLSWKAPAVTLPEGVKMVYNLEIGQGGCDEFGNCSWTQIWNTWNSNKQISTTSLTVPYLFPIQTTQEALDNPYHLNIRVSFVDQLTGNQLGSGGSAHTEFTVGEPIDMDAEFTLSGAVTVDDPSIEPTRLRAALMKEVQADGSFTRTVMKIADIQGTTGYSLTLRIGDFLENATANSWINLVLIDDPDDSLASGSPLTNTDMVYWPDSSGANMWFDTWGGFLRVKKDTCTATGTCYYEEKIITGGEAITGPRFYLGQTAYVPPDPTQVDPVPAAVLSQMFTITGTVDTTGVERPKVILIKEGYNATTGFHVQTVLRVGIIEGEIYTLNAYVGDFYNTDGSPTDSWYQIVLVNDPDPADTTRLPASESLPLGDLPTWWPNNANGNFGFDTWRGGELYVYKDSYDESTFAWSYEDWAVPGDTTLITGPFLGTMTAP